jgi:hypothetical protein
LAIRDWRAKFADGGQIQKTTLGAVAAAAVLAGIVLRLMFPSDIEFKADEEWTFAHVRAVLAGASLPMSGMPTSIGGANPGPSLWVFVLLGRVFGAATAPDLARGVQICAGAALVGALLFARFAVDARQRELWYWAAALWAVNPLAIIFERKIWIVIVSDMWRIDLEEVLSFPDASQPELMVAS